MENSQIKSLTHGGGFGLCRRGFNRRVSLYKNDVHLRGRRRYSEMENYQIKSLTHGGGFGLCRRGFNRRVSLNQTESRN
ncbi:hypothetical protein, partial [Microcoleus sp. CAWBG52]|uniref:hypothetical protein n=1 Tax=Microcoleus sp. CAWBG52 TaxID=2841649 RepID=UPI0025D6397A